jgi:hypothetical protein
MISSAVNAVAGADAARTIPFDYVFRFELEGKPGKTHSKIVTVSVEGTFTAVSIGYGIVSEPTVREFGPSSVAIPIATTGPNLGDQSFADVIRGLSLALGEPGAGTVVGPRAAAALVNGIRINPRVAAAAFADGGSGPLPPGALARLFEVVPLPSAGVQFLYAIRDEASGREFQSEAMLNTAGLGIDDGTRPFRQFARAMTFRPRATIRMDVTELPTTFKGLLHVSLHGYKVLGAPPEAPALLAGGPRAR